MFTGFFTKYIPNNSKGNNTQKSCNLCFSNLLGQIYHSSSKTSSDQTASFQNIIAATRLKINERGLLVAKFATSQTTTKLEQIAEKTFNQTEEKVNIFSTLPTVMGLVNLAMSKALTTL